VNKKYRLNFLSLYFKLRAKTFNRLNIRARKPYKKQERNSIGTVLKAVF
jgi:hypothetical protein